MDWVPGEKDLEAYAAYAVDWLLKGEEGTESAVDAELTLVAYPDDQAYLRYHGPDPSLPDADSHHRFLRELARQLVGHRVTARIVMLRTDEYEAWRDESGLQDTPEARTQWAAENADRGDD